MSSTDVEELDFRSILSRERPEILEIKPDGTLIRSVARRGSANGVTETVLGSGFHTDIDAYAAADRHFLTSVASPDYSEGHTDVVVADLFSGCGAMALGVAEAARSLGARFIPAVVCDVSQPALDVYANNFKLPKISTRNLEEMSSVLEGQTTPVELTLRRQIGERRIDLLVGGPPCQGHSNLNNVTRRSDPKNALYFKMARFARLFEPKFIMIENVPTVIHDEGAVVDRTLTALRKLDYEVDHRVVDLSKLGVAQSRRRHVTIAYHKDTGRVPDISRMVSNYFVSQPRDLWWAIGDLEDTKTDSLIDAVPDYAEESKRRINVLFEENQFDLSDEHRPDCHRTKPHTYGSVYGRLRWTQLGPTITTGFSTPGRGRYIHPSRRRTITAHEAARIQFIPDSFKFDGMKSRRELTEAIGNAVPPKLSYVLTLEMLR